jgi:hypothetical protein
MEMSYVGIAYYGSVRSGAGEERLAGEESVRTVYEAGLYVNRGQSWKLRKYERRLWNL